jgi:hypothetical protein
MRKFIIVVLTIIITSLLSGSSYARRETSCLVEEVGVIETYAITTMALDGPNLYSIHSSDGLKIYDVSTPSAISAVGKMKLAGIGCGIGVSGAYAYVTLTDQMGLFYKMSVVDISNPASPILRGSVDLLPSLSAYTHDVIASGTYVYVANGFSGLQIIDVSDPDAPSIAASFDTGGYANGLALSGGYAYIAVDVGGLLIADVSTPTSPTLVGGIPMPVSLCDVAVQSGYAYMAAGANGVKIVDVTDPTAPFLVTTVDTPGYAYGISASDQYAYIADGDEGLQAVDISDPANAFLCGSLWLGSVRRIETSNTFAYVTGPEGLRIVDLLDAVNPSLVEIPPKLHYSRGVAVSGTHAYIGDGVYGGLQVADISIPSAPALVGNAPTSDEAVGVAVSGQYAYVADVMGGLLVFDISNPAAPILEGSVNIPSYAYDVAVVGSYAYVAAAYSGLLIIDVSVPSAPSIIRTVDTDDYAYAVAVSGNYAYLADGAGGVRIIDVSAPPTASIVATIDGLFCIDVAVAGSYAYVADATNGLQIVDITDPIAPSIVGSVAPVEEGWITSVAISGNYVFAANNITGMWDTYTYSKLLIIDVSEPSSAQIVDSIDVPDSISDLASTTGFVYVADNAGGLRIVNPCNPGSPLTEIHLVSPAPGSILTSPPTFEWSAIGGMNNGFVVEIGFSQKRRFYSTWKDLHLPIYTSSWTLPLSIWQRIPAGRKMYWWVRGRDPDRPPLKVISNEVWTFYRE